MCPIRPFQTIFLPSIWFVCLACCYMISVDSNLSTFHLGSPQTEQWFTYFRGFSFLWRNRHNIPKVLKKKAKQKSMRHGYNFYEHLTVQYFVQSRWIWRGASLCLLDWLVQFRIYRKWTFTSFQLVFLRFGNIIS